MIYYIMSLAVSILFIVSVVRNDYFRLFHTTHFGVNRNAAKRYIITKNL